MHPREVASLLTHAGFALGKSQHEIGQLIGVSRRTISRYVSGGGWLTASQAESLTRALHPVDEALARTAASAGGLTLADLGLDPALNAEAVRKDRARRIRLVLYEAASAIDVSPRAVAPALHAAVKAAKEEGLAMGDVEAALGEMLATPKAAKKAGRREG
jgi:transcriptional regulator with XRE-family HTH domain